MSVDYCVLLTSNIDNRYLNNVNLFKSYLNNRNIPYDEIEATKDENIKLRDALLEVAMNSGAKVEYPYFFIMRSNRNIQFIGNWEKVQYLIDANSIDEDTLRDNPDTCTLDRLFRTMM